MQSNMDNAQDAPIREAMKMAASPAGKQLYALLQEKYGAQLNEAITKASGGDYSGAKELLSSYLSTPEAQALVKKLGG